MSDGFLMQVEAELPDRIPPEQFLSAFESLTVRPQVPDIIAVVLGEAVYNFRAALDYAVGQVSLKQTPAWPKNRARRNQFPIENRAPGFSARRQPPLPESVMASPRTSKGCSPTTTASGRGDWLICRILTSTIG